MRLDASTRFGIAFCVNALGLADVGHADIETCIEMRLTLERFGSRFGSRWMRTQNMCWLAYSLEWCFSTIQETP